MIMYGLFTAQDELYIKIKLEISFVIHFFFTKRSFIEHLPNIHCARVTKVSVKMSLPSRSLVS